MKKPNLTSSVPQHITIDNKDYIVVSIGRQNYASILRGFATEIDETITFKCVPLKKGLDEKN